MIRHEQFRECAICGERDRSRLDLLGSNEWRNIWVCKHDLQCEGPKAFGRNRLVEL